MHTYAPSGNFNSILKLEELECYHLPKSFVKNGDGVGEMQTSAPQKAKRSGLVDYALRVEQLDNWSAMPWCLLPFAQRDHSRGCGGDGCGYSCRRLEWETVRGQRVQIVRN